MIEMPSEKDFIDTLVACVVEQVQRIVREEIAMAVERLEERTRES